MSGKMLLAGLVTIVWAVLAVWNVMDSALWRALLFGAGAMRFGFQTFRLREKLELRPMQYGALGLLRCGR